MIDRPFAEHFAKEWIDAWNAHDLDAILAHYADDVVFRSPRIAQVMNEPVAFVAGKAALARYWGKALSIATDLHFTFEALPRQRQPHHRLPQPPGPKRGRNLCFRC